MKTMSFLLFILISLTATSQTCLPNEETGVAVGLSGGYASNQRFTGTYSIGGQIRNNWLYGQDHVSVNLQIFNNLSKVGTPVIIEGRVGHVLNNLCEIYGGYGYHLSKSDAAQAKSRISYSGFKPAYGIAKRFDNSWWTVSAGMSGNIFLLQLGILVIR